MKLKLLPITIAIALIALQAFVLLYHPEHKHIVQQVQQQIQQIPLPPVKQIVPHIKQLAPVIKEPCHYGFYESIC